MSRFRFDADLGICVPFSYGGCDGNENNFESVASCQAACGGPTPLDRCDSPTECVLVGTAPCDCGPPSLGKFIAIRADAVDRYERERGCRDVLCGPCPPPPDGLSTRALFVATCLDGRCAPVDLRETRATACRVDEDCSLRHGSGCCEGCSTSDPVALSSPEALASLVCGDAPVPCPGCDPPPFAGIGAICAGGTCAAVRTPITFPGESAVPPLPVPPSPPAR